MILTKIATPLLVATVLLGPAHAQTVSRPPALLVHGNYCGPGNNAPLAPIDALDAACSRHDACTPQDGLPPRACNLRLEREAAMIARDPRQSEDVRDMADLVAMGASLMMAGSGQRGGHRGLMPTTAVSHHALPAVDGSAIRPAAPEMSDDE